MLAVHRNLMNQNLQIHTTDPIPSPGTHPQGPHIPVRAARTELSAKKTNAWGGFELPVVTDTATTAQSAPQPLNSSHRGKDSSFFFIKRRTWEQWAGQGNLTF